MQPKFDTIIFDLGAVLIDWNPRYLYRKIFKTEDVSIGPFVLTNEELPAMMIVDCIARQIEGVLGDFNSLEESRIASPDVYTRPDVFEYKKKKYKVPPVLLSGNHKKIDEWRARGLTK